MSEIQPSLGELEDAQNTAYENFFTARDAVTAAGGRGVAARPKNRNFVTAV